MVPPKNVDLLSKIDRAVAALADLGSADVFDRDLTDAIRSFADRLGYVRGAVKRGRPPAAADQLPPRLARAALRREARERVKR